MTDNYEPERYELREAPVHLFALTRRDLLGGLGAGLLLVAATPAEAQRGGGAGTLESRLHIAEDGAITILTGKVEEGQGALTELAMAAAEELRLPVESVRMVMADTGRTPNDGTTAGSATTPRTLPMVRTAAAAARELLASASARSGKQYTYADLAKSPELAAALKDAPPAATPLTAARNWRTLGHPHVRIDAKEIVTGTHRYPRDIVRPGMLYGRVLRAPSYGAVLASADLSSAQKLPEVVAVRDGAFVGCAAPTSYAARKALETVAATAQWTEPEQPSGDTLFARLKQTARPQARPQGAERGSVETALQSARRRFKGEYRVAYVQHAPMEPRAAVAEWQDGQLTVWTGTSNPFSVRQALAEAFHLPQERVRVIVPHFGGGFGGKHTGEAAIEAARLAKEAAKPVAVQWTRAEEFAWAYFRPAALIEIEAGLDGANAITSWDFTNYNSGTAALDTPYNIANARARFLPSDSPLRQGSYRCLAATANNFAREAFTDELAEAAGKDPLDFRLAHLSSDRLRNVLAAAAERFGWAERRRRQRKPGTGIGIACGTEKNSVVAACCEIQMDAAGVTPKVLEVVEAFECGPILNPANLRCQVEGCITMGLGPALREEIQFQNGRVTNGRFASYRVPRFRDIPKLDVVLLDRKDAEPAGAGETPIIAIAPAIANAVFDATGKRVRTMPVRLPRA
jgi:isoquinoline 1-oxidoreductase